MLQVARAYKVLQALQVQLALREAKGFKELQARLVLQARPGQLVLRELPALKEIRGLPALLVQPVPQARQD